MSLSTSLSRRAVPAGGQPIGTLTSRALAHPELISLAAGFVDQTSLPLTSLGDAWRSLLSEPAEGYAALQYGTTAAYYRFVHYERNPVAHNTIRLSYGEKSPERIREGIRLLAATIRKVCGHAIGDGPADVIAKRA